MSRHPGDYSKPLSVVSLVDKNPRRTHRSQPPPPAALVAYWSYREADDFDGPTVGHAVVPWPAILPPVPFAATWAELAIDFELFAQLALMIARLQAALAEGGRVTEQEYRERVQAVLDHLQQQQTFLQTQQSNIRGTYLGTYLHHRTHSPCMQHN